MIESAKDTMLPDDTNLPEGGFEVMAKGALCQQGYPPRILSFKQFQETIVPPMPYGIALCIEYACENERKVVIKRCHLCGYGYGLH
ncbi:hypothetical protein ACFX12_014572 [Malus domestica]